jgi:5-methylcytosine-specific restriction endonuclease McrA
LIDEIKEKEVTNKISRKYSCFEYVGGYVNCAGYLYLLCKDCGKIFRYNAQITRPAYKSTVNCPICKDTLINIDRKKKKQENDIAKEQRKEDRFIEKFNNRYGNAFEYIGGYNTEKHNRITIKCKECGYIRTRGRNKIFIDNIACPKCKNNRKNMKMHNCIECGKEFLQWSEQQVLCKECHEVQERRKRTSKSKVYKRLRESRALKNGKVDYSITLTRLIERDNHICKLCNRKVNEEDYTYVNDVFIAGNDYPSIDHIVPLSKGGVHQWNNVQLAHRICNSIKNDKEVNE